MSTSPSSRQRSNPRFQAALPARARVEGVDHECLAEDLSRAGVLLVGPMPRPESPQVTFAVRTPTGDLELELTGRVVHVHEDGETTRIGVQFETLDEATGEQLERLVSRVVAGIAPAALDGLNEASSPAQVRNALARIPLAHRVNLASRAGSRERIWLKYDVAPQVLEGLARNPNINLPEIKTMLRNPTLLPSTLELIADDPRWRRDEESRMMIATHPRVTFQTADKVVGHLSQLAVQRLVQKPGLQPGVKQKLMARFAKQFRR